MLAAACVVRDVVSGSLQYAKYLYAIGNFIELSKLSNQGVRSNFNTEPKGPQIVSLLLAPESVIL